MIRPGGFKGLALAFAIASIVATAPPGAAQSIPPGADADWNQAVNRYERLAREGHVDAALYYNLGTAYAQRGDRGRAIWMLLKALRLSPRDADIRHNLNLLAPDLASQVAVFPLPPVEYAFSRLTVNEWAGLAAGLTITAGLLLALAFTRRKEGGARALLRKMAVAAGLLAAVGHAAAGLKYYDEHVAASGIIVAEETHGRSLPSEEAPPDPYPLAPGTFIRVDDAEVEGWIKATYLGKNQVFIRRDQMEFL